MRARRTEERGPTVNCVSCRREIADASNFCPYCGSTQGAAPSTPAAGGPAPLGGVRAPTPPQVPQGTYSQGGMPGGAAMPAASQRATMSMVLGIGALVGDFLCCWCYGLGGLLGIGLGLTAFIMGRNELEDIAAGFSSPAGQSSANMGKTLGLIGMIIGGLVFLIGIGFLVLVIASEAGNSSSYPY